MNPLDEIKDDILKMLILLQSVTKEHTEAQDLLEEWIEKYRIQ